MTESEVISRVRRLRSNGLSFTEIAAALNADGVPHALGAGWTASRAQTFFNASNASRRIMSVDLNCGHVAHFDPPPVVGDTVWCHRCADYRQADTGLPVNYGTRATNSLATFRKEVPAVEQVRTEAAR